MKYQIKGWRKFAEEDVYMEGCIPDTSWENGGSDCFSAGNPEDAILAFARFAGDDSPEAIERNACGEDGRIDVCVMEAEDGTAASQREIQLWKQGKVRLWHSVYTGYLERVEAVKA